MLWSPTGPTLEALVSPSSTRFVPLASGNLGGVARVFGGATGGTFTLGGDAVTNIPGTDHAIPLAAGQDIIVAYGPGVTDISASVAGIFITPGIGRP